MTETYINRYWDTGAYVPYILQKLVWWKPGEPEFEGVKPEWTIYKLNTKEVLHHFAREDRKYFSGRDFGASAFFISCNLCH